MTDIVKRLRLINACAAGCNGRCLECPDTVAHEAADEIERLREEKDEWIGRYQAELDDNHRMIAWYKEACADRDQLRKALAAADSVCGKNNCNCPGAKKVRSAIDGTIPRMPVDRVGGW